MGVHAHVACSGQCKERSPAQRGQHFFEGRERGDFHHSGLQRRRRYDLFNVRRVGKSQDPDSVSDRRHWGGAVNRLVRLRARDHAEAELRYRCRLSERRRERIQCHRRDSRQRQTG